MKYTSWHFNNIYKTARIGDGTKIGSYVEIGDKVKIGKNCIISSGVFIPGGITIENDCFLGPKVCFTNDKYPPSHGKHWMKTLVKQGAKIGGHATILPGITIGEKAMVGAGAVVTKNIPNKETWAGNPAKKLKKDTNKQKRN